MDVATNVGLAANPWQCPVPDLHKLKLPAILHWDMQVFVVLAKVADNQFTIYHPGFGKQRYTAMEFERHYGEVALEIAQ
jgi:ATP-binding cassette subfamily B protein RaxB